MAHPNGTEFAITHLSTGLRLHYAKRGEKEGEAIVFLHAYADSWFSYDRVLHLLSPAYHALALLGLDGDVSCDDDHGCAPLLSPSNGAERSLMYRTGSFVAWCT